MKKIIAAALISVAPFAANAADNWTGPYVGGQAGGQFGNASGPYEYANQTGPSPYSLTPYGAVVGVRIGYNQQINNLVLGLEADANLTAGVKAATTLPGGYNVGAQNPFNTDLRVRLGYDLGTELPYVAAGLAYGDVKTTYSGADQAPFANTDPHTGYTLGVGLEHKFNSQLSATAEYRYTDFGSKSFTNKTFNTYDNVKYTTSSILVGVNYHF